MKIEWRVRSKPLEPAGLAARGEAARRVALRLLERDDEALARLDGVTGQSLLVVRGDAELLPWADGVVYFGVEPDSPLLLLPTTMEPSLPARLLEQAFRREHPRLAPPILVLPGETSLLSLGAARPISRAALQAWLKTLS